MPVVLHDTVEKRLHLLPVLEHRDLRDGKLEDGLRVRGIQATAGPWAAFLIAGLLLEDVAPAMSITVGPIVHLIAENVGMSVVIGVVDPRDEIGSDVGLREPAGGEGERQHGALPEDMVLSDGLAETLLQAGRRRNLLDHLDHART